MRRLKTAAPENQELQVNVGIDFGTSSTKVIYTDRQFVPRHVCSFPENPAGYPPVCLPSSVRVDDGKVYFGDEAERRADGVVYRSFKMCMACVPATGLCGHCPNPLGATRRSGIFSMDGCGTGDVTAEEVSAWYLAYVVNLATGRVERAYPGVRTRRTYQIAAPLKSCDSSVEKLAFERAIHIAARISPIVEQGIDLADLRAFYRSECEELAEGGLPPESERDTCVIPETHAAIIGFVRSPTSEDGLYAIVDVGAGTTDLSFLRLYKAGGVLSYYSSEVVSRGGDAVDAEILRRLAAGRAALDPGTRSNLLGRIRLAKHLDFPIEVGMGVSTDKHVVQQAASDVAGQIFQDYERTWARAYQKEMGQSRWRRYGLYLCGGGSQLRPAFPHAFRRPPKPQCGIVEQVDVSTFEVPPELRYDSDPSLTPEPFGFLLLVAYGVAFPRPRIPDWLLSSLVEPLEAMALEPEQPQYMEYERYEYY